MLTLIDKLKICAVVLVLALVFSPGLILTIPPRKGSSLGFLGLGFLHSKETRILSMIIHSIIISFVLFLILTYAPVIQSIGQSIDTIETTVEDVEDEGEIIVGDDQAELRREEKSDLS